MSERKAIISGILCSDISLNPISKGTPKSRFAVAAIEVNGGEKFTTVIPCTAYSNLDFLQKYFFKGKSIEIEEQLNHYTYTRKDGSKSIGFGILVSEIVFCPISTVENISSDEAATEANNQ